MKTEKAYPFPHPLILSDPVPEILQSWAVEGYPNETCGLVLGRRNGTKIEALWTTRAENLNRDRPRDRFILDPAGFVVADRQARALGLEIVGIWHTHPDHSARPSRTDLEAAWEGYSYLILSTSESEVVDLRSWRLQDCQFHEQDIQREETLS